MRIVSANFQAQFFPIPFAGIPFRTSILKKIGSVTPTTRKSTHDVSQVNSNVGLRRLSVQLARRLQGATTGEKEYTPPPWDPSFLGLSPDPIGHRAKKAMVYTIFLGKQGKRVYTIGPERGVYTIECSDPEKEKKEGLHGGGVYFFLRTCTVDTLN